jgi:DNA-binding NarL/FixJ family response regulator
VRANEQQPVTVMVAEELGLVRAGLIALIQSLGGYAVTAGCADGIQALAACRKRPGPAIALVDLQVSGLYALEIVRQLHEEHSPTRVIILSVRTDRKTVLESLRTGARGFLVKSGDAEDLKNALAKVHQGSIYLSPALDAAAIFFPQTAAPADPLESLSAREFQVFSLLVEGLRAKEVAARLRLSPKTVDTYRASLMKKLDIHDIAGLVKFALNHKLVPAQE